MGLEEEVSVEQKKRVLIQSTEESAPVKIKTTRDKKQKAGTGTSDDVKNDVKNDIKKIRQGLSFLFMASSTLITRYNAVDAEIIVKHAPSCIDAWCRLAESDERVRSFLLASMSSSPYLEVFATTMAMVIPILSNHFHLPFAHDENEHKDTEKKEKEAKEAKEAKHGWY